MKPLTYHTDPGHGWLEVDRSELDRLGISGRISPYSYMRGATAYLEEDCDATLYIDAVRAETGRNPDYVEKHTNDSSPIRSYQPFNPGA